MELIYLIHTYYRVRDLVISTNIMFNNNVQHMYLAVSCLQFLELPDFEVMVD